jgi:hypothetical protein
MMVRRSGARRDAPALRFLLLCIAGWVVLRIVMTWNPAVPPPRDTPLAPWSAPVPFAVTAPAPRAALQQALPALPRLSPARAAEVAASAVPETALVPAASDPSPRGGPGADRHSLRLALMARLLPSMPGGAARSALAGGGPAWFPLPAASRAEPGQGKPFWIQRQLAGWSLAGWLYLRDDAVAAPGGIAAASQLGGSQAGLRLAYGFGDAGRTRAYGRATVAGRRAEQREVVIGLAFAPLAQVPVDFAIEQRLAIGRDGRRALAAMVSGGVSDVALPGGFRLDAYGQAGVVGARRRDGFADGAVVVDHRLGTDEASPLRLGALAAGAVQPGAARVDVGPRLTLRLPDVGAGSRIALDWRQRVAGDARPESGLALTLAADF